MRDIADNAPSADGHPTVRVYSVEGEKKLVRPFETLGRKRLFEDEDEND